jgi:hypothetical protein
MEFFDKARKYGCFLNQRHVTLGVASDPCFKLGIVQSFCFPPKSRQVIGIFSCKVNQCIVLIKRCINMRLFWHLDPPLVLKRASELIKMGILTNRGGPVRLT